MTSTTAHAHNRFQKAFLQSHGLTLKHSNLMEEFRAIFSDIKTYRVFGAYKKVVIAKLRTIGSRLAPTSVKTIKSILAIIKRRNVNQIVEGFDISSYVVAYGLGFNDSIIIARHMRSKYLLEQFLWRAFYYQADVDDNSLREYKWSVSKRLQSSFFKGQTGYALVDASVICLRKTGKLSNKLRMVIASFFCKNLLQPWMDGEKFFGKYLEDYDRVVNRGNWIWCSQLRYDNQQFVRFFSPDLQLKKLLKTSNGREWYEQWKQPEYKKIIDWNESCKHYRAWRKLMAAR